MPHCHGSIEVAKILKRLHPHVPISFGGLSSSIFHEDLIKYDCIDFVFRGDSTEEPMRMLVERVARAARTHTPLGDLSDIPNLTWKDAEGAVHINPLSWVPDDMDAISKMCIRDRVIHFRLDDLVHFLLGASEFRNGRPYRLCHGWQLVGSENEEPEQQNEEQLNSTDTCLLYTS